MMVHFTNPYFLLPALAVPPLIWWWLRQRGGALRYPATQGLAGLPSGRSKWARYGGAALRGLALLLLIVAIAGPRWPDRHTRIDTEGIAIQMVVDVSGSMAEPDFDWDGPIARLTAVKRAVDLFVAGGDAEGNHFEGRGNDLIGLVTFATRPESACPLTLSHSALLKMLKGEQPRSIPGESETNISDALILGLHRLHAAGPRRKVLVLLSDGEHNINPPPSGMTPRQAAQIAGNLGVRVYCIDAGGDGSTITEPGAHADSAANRELGARTLQEVAQITGGRCFSARDTKSLLSVWHEIDALERSDITSFQYRRYHEGFGWFALAALATWLLVGALEQTFWQRVP